MEDKKHIFLKRNINKISSYPLTHEMHEYFCDKKIMKNANIGRQNGTQVWNNDYIYRKIRNMIIVNSREFRANQSKYLKMASDGEDVILKSRGTGSFKIVPLAKDDTLMTREELDARIAKATKDYKNGDFTSINTPEDLKAFLESL